MGREAGKERGEEEGNERGGVRAGRCGVGASRSIKVPISSSLRVFFDKSQMTPISPYKSLLFGLDGTYKDFFKSLNQ